MSVMEGLVYIVLIVAAILPIIILLNRTPPASRSVQEIPMWRVRTWKRCGRERYTERKPMGVKNGR